MDKEIEGICFIRLILKIRFSVNVLENIFRAVTVSRKILIALNPIDNKSKSSSLSREILRQR